MHVGQSEPAALVAESQSLMVDAQQMQQRCLKIMNMDGILDDVITQFVGRPKLHAGLNSASGQPHGKTTWVMIAPELSGR